MFAKTCLTVSLLAVLLVLLRTPPSPEQDGTPSPKEVEEQLESRSVAALKPQHSPPLTEIKIKVREEEATSVREDTVEDPEDRGDPIARAQRDEEERIVRRLRNPDIIPER
jgi:hypothetical protein